MELRNQTNNLQNKQNIIITTGEVLRFTETNDCVVRLKFHFFTTCHVGVNVPILSNPINT